jgi:transcriptional regulator with XRE-family HTH domain
VFTSNVPVMTERKRRNVQPRYLDGRALRRKRLEAGLEQERLAEMVGTDRPAIAHYENCDYGCRIGMLHKLAHALGCKPTDLLLPDVLTDSKDGEAAL